MTLPVCPDGHEALSGQRFCRTCGQVLTQGPTRIPARMCPNNHVASADDKFCRVCGMRVTGSAPPAAWDGDAWMASTTSTPPPPARDRTAFLPLGFVADDQAGESIPVLPERKSRRKMLIVVGVVGVLVVARQSASVRPTVQQAIDGVRSCSGSPSAGMAALQQAVSVRQNILTGLQSVTADSLPHGSQLVGDLTSAVRDSITADDDYIAWMNDVGSNGTACGSDPPQDGQFNAGQAASQTATADKVSFVALWNPLAPTYGQQTYSSNDF